jgi:ketosteroid isomerase-like protein
VSAAELLRAGFAAFAAGDLAAVRAIFAEDVSWTIPGRSPLAGTYVGLDALLGMLGRTAELTDGTYRAEPRWVLGGEDEVTALYRATGRRGDREIDIDQLFLGELREGRIATVVVLATDQSVFDAFWA